MNRSALLRLVRCQLSSLFVLCSITSSAAPGDLDLSFGGGTGVVFASPIRTNDTPMATVRRADGRFVVGGYCNAESLSRAFCASSRNADGSADTSFNTTGSVVTQLTSPVVTPIADTGRSLAIQADGKVVLAGVCGTSTTDFCVARYLGSGALDSSFGTNGIRFIDFGNSGNARDDANQVLIQADGRIILIGYCNGQAMFCIARLTSSGQLDTSFNSTGLVMTDMTNDLDLAFTGAILSDGKLVVGGMCRTTPGTPFTAYDFCLARYTNAGALDASFGTSGKVITAVGTEWDRLLTLKLLSDGKLLATGQCKVSDGGSGLHDSFCAVRYTAAGEIDTSFGSAGKVTLSQWPEFRYGSVDLYPDGRILVSAACRDLRTVGAGGCATATFGSNQLLLMRLTANGALDTTFKGGGITYFKLDNYGATQPPTNATLLPDGKILYTTSCSVGAQGDPNPNGSVFCFARFEGEAITPAAACLLDLDGDGRISLTIDALLHLRIALGTPENTRTVGINFPAAATRNTWNAIDTHLRSLCPANAPYCALDLDGDSANSAATDALLHARLAIGLRDSRAITGITFGQNAARGSWASLRAHLTNQCGVTGLQ